MIAESTKRHTIILKLSIGCMFVLAAVFAVVFFVLKNEEKKYANRIYPTVYINNVKVGNMSTEKVKELFEKKNKELQKASINVEYNKTQIATFSATTLRLKYDATGIADRAYLIGRSSHFPSRIYQQIASIMGFRAFNFAIYPEYDENYVKERLTTFEESYNAPAKNALFKFEDGKVNEFRQEKNGAEIESQRFLEDIDKTIKSFTKTPAVITVSLRSRVLKPEITLAEANKFGIEELIAEGKSDYTHSIPERIHNVLLAASKFNGVLIPKGKVFSFGETIGDISALTGYKPAYVIKNGKTVLGDGGGVCQISTTLFRAALNAGLPITERHAHAYRVSYYENDSKPGFDATIFSPTVDLKFLNDTPASILIQTEVDEENNLVTFKFYGKRDNRKVEISPVTVYDLQPAPAPVYQDDPTLKKGIVRQVDFAVGGAKASFDYKVIKDGKVHFEKNFFSAYRPWAAVYLVGQAD